MHALDMCPVYGLYAASRKLIKTYSKHLEPLGITYPQYLVLLCLFKKNECSVDMIGQELFLDSGTLSPLLKRLEANNLITRQYNSLDERKRVIKLTEQAYELEKEFLNVRGLVSLEVKLSQEEIEQLNFLLKKIYKKTI